MRQNSSVLNIALKGKGGRRWREKNLEEIAMTMRTTMADSKFSRIYTLDTVATTYAFLIFSMGST
jgi:hypothetical protein